MECCEVGNRAFALLDSRVPIEKKSDLPAEPVGMLEWCFPSEGRASRSSEDFLRLMTRFY